MRQGLPTIQLLAQESEWGSIWVWSLVLIGFLVFMFVVVTFIRRGLRGDDTPTTGPAFTLGDLRDLHKRGQMTDDEYARAKAALVNAIKTAPIVAPSTSYKPVTGQPDARRGTRRDTPR